VGQLPGCSHVFQMICAVKRLQACRNLLQHTGSISQCVNALLRVTAVAGMLRPPWSTRVELDA
jgi:hypothetical protein